MSWVRTAVDRVAEDEHEVLHQTVFGGYGCKPDVFWAVDPVDVPYQLKENVEEAAKDDCSISATCIIIRVNTLPALDDEELRSTGNPVGCFMVYMGTEPSNVEFNRKMNIYEDRRPVTPTSQQAAAGPQMSRLKRLSVSLGLSDLPSIVHNTHSSLSIPPAAIDSDSEKAPPPLPEDIPPEKAQTILANRDRRRRMSQQYQQAAIRRQSAVAALTTVPFQQQQQWPSTSPFKFRSEHPFEQKTTETRHRRTARPVSMYADVRLTPLGPSRRFSQLQITPPLPEEDEEPDPLTPVPNNNNKPFSFPPLPSDTDNTTTTTTTTQIATVPSESPPPVYLEDPPLPPPRSNRRRESSRLFAEARHQQQIQSTPPAKKIRPGSLSGRSFMLEDIERNERMNRKRATTLAAIDGVGIWDLSTLHSPTTTVATEEEEEMDEEARERKKADATARALRRLEGCHSPTKAESGAAGDDSRRRKSVAFSPSSFSEPAVSAPVPVPSPQPPVTVPKEISVVLSTPDPGAGGGASASSSTFPSPRRNSETVRAEAKALYGKPVIDIVEQGDDGGGDGTAAKRNKRYRKSLAVFSRRGWADGPLFPSSAAAADEEPTGHMRLASVVDGGGYHKEATGAIGGKKTKVSRLKRFSIQIGRLFR